MPRVIWSREATVALERIYHFLAVRDKGLAKRALSTIHDGAKLLEVQPLLGHPVAGGHAPSRELLVRFGRTGYLIRYVGENDRVVIVSIRHSKQSAP